MNPFGPSVVYLDFIEPPTSRDGMTMGSKTPSQWGEVAGA